MPRLFVALDLPDEVKEELDRLDHGVPGARWVQDRQFHLTLAFLGDVRGPAVESIRLGLNGVRADPFELRLRGLGHFPPRGAPRALWIGVEEDDEVAQLQRRIRSRLKRLGVTIEARKFSPHVTLARLKDARLPSLLDYIEGHVGVATEPFAVTDFQLFSSVLGRAGARHSIEASYPLFA